MSQGLKEGMGFEFTYTVPVEKTVPHLFPEFPEGGRMPEVLATGFLVGLLEFACIKFINPHIDWPRQQTVGIGIQLTRAGWKRWRGASSLSRSRPATAWIPSARPPMSASSSTQRSSTPRWRRRRLLGKPLSPLRDVGEKSSP